MRRELISILCVIALCAAFVSHASTTRLRVLSIGNSYSADAMAYVPLIMQDLAPDVELTLAIAYWGGTTLQTHWERGVQGKHAYEHYYKWQDGQWTEPMPQWSFGIKWAVAEEPWDLIVLQQGSTHSRDFSTFEPYCNNLITWINARVNNRPRYAWLMTPAYPTGYTRLAEDETSADMWADIVSCTRQLFDQEHFDLLLACGTATENLRCTPLDSFGQFGHLSYEGLHLQDGYGRLVENYAVVIALFEMLNLGSAPLEADCTTPTAQWITNNHIPSPHGSCTAISDEERALVIKCAQLAQARPFVLSPTTKLVGDTNDDDRVDVIDLNNVIGMILSGGIDPSGDVNGDGTVDVFDLGDLINILLHR